MVSQVCSKHFDALFVEWQLRTPPHVLVSICRSGNTLQRITQEALLHCSKHVSSHRESRFLNGPKQLVLERHVHCTNPDGSRRRCRPGTTSTSLQQSTGTALRPMLRVGRRRKVTASMHHLVLRPPLGGCCARHRGHLPTDRRMVCHKTCSRKEWHVPPLTPERPPATSLHVTRDRKYCHQLTRLWLQGQLSNPAMRAPRTHNLVERAN